MDVPPAGPGSMLSWEDVLRRGCEAQGEGARAPPQKRRRGGPRRTWPRSSTPRAPRASRRASCSPTATSWRTSAAGSADQHRAHGPGAGVPAAEPLLRAHARLCLFLAGLSIAYAESIDKVADNMGEVQPTIMAAVPRFYEKVYAKVLDQAAHASFLKKLLVHWSINTTTTWAERRGRESCVGPWLGSPVRARQAARAQEAADQDGREACGSSFRAARPCRGTWPSSSGAPGSRSARGTGSPRRRPW